MNDDRQTPDEDRSWLERLTDVFSSDPENQEELLEILETAKENHIIDQDVLRIIDGAMRIAETEARKTMVPRSQMVCIRTDQSLEEILSFVIETAHSRYPVIGDSSDEVLGLLLTKDLLPLILSSRENFDIHKLLRPITFVPESKRLNTLLREFRDKHIHMAVVIDEYGSVAGLITLEDILEEIVGEIEDEYDDNIAFIKRLNSHEYCVNCLTPLETFNNKFTTDFQHTYCSTIGDYIIHQLQHRPKTGEVFTIDAWRFRILEVDEQQHYWLRLSPNLRQNQP